MIATTSRRPCCFLSERLFVVEVAGLIAGYFGPTFPADQLYFLASAPDPGSPSCHCGLIALAPSFSLLVGFVRSVWYLAQGFLLTGALASCRAPLIRDALTRSFALLVGFIRSLWDLARGLLLAGVLASCRPPLDPGSPSHQPQAAGLLLFLGLDLIAGLSAFFHQFGHLVGGVGFPET